MENKRLYLKIKFFLFSRENEDGEVRERLLKEQEYLAHFDNKHDANARLSKTIRMIRDILRQIFFVNGD